MIFSGTLEILLGESCVACAHAGGMHLVRIVLLLDFPDPDALVTRRREGDDALSHTAHCTPVRYAMLPLNCHEFR